MKVISISTDRNIFATDAPVRARMIEQGALVDEMHIVIFARRSLGLLKETIPGTNITIYPTNSVSALTYIPDALAIASRIVKGVAREWVVSTQDPFETGIVGFALRFRYGIPLHVQVHTDPFSPHWRAGSLLNHFRYGIAQFILHVADAVRVVSDRVRREVVRLRSDVNSVFMVPIFVDTAQTQVQTEDIRGSYPHASKIVLSVGRLEAEKDFSLLIRSFRAVLEVEPQAILLIVGSGSWHQALLTEIDANDLEEKVRLLPWSHNIGSYYRAADCYVQSSRYEGWGMAVIEAMAHGAPVVMTDVGCAGEVVVDGVSGMVVPPRNEERLAQAIIQVLTNDELRAQLVDGAREMISKLATKAETLELYKASWEYAYKKK